VNYALYTAKFVILTLKCTKMRSAGEAQVRKKRRKGKVDEVGRGEGKGSGVTRVWR